MDITLQPIAYIKNSRKDIADDYWGSVITEITLADHLPAAAFENPEYPVMGIFCQRKKDRPNKIGLCIATLLSHNNRTITVKGLDAIDGTPVLDIKPVFKEFLPVDSVKQPDWVAQLMTAYWAS